MLKQASVHQIRTGQITRRDGLIVISMCFYPRGLRKELLDEYRSDLAPDRTLFREFRAFQKTVGHEAAFARSRYEKRFTLSPQALHHLAFLTHLSREQDVYLVCQCEIGKRCHREILLLLAKNRFNAQIDPVFNRYDTFMKLLQRTKPRSSQAEYR